MKMRYFLMLKVFSNFEWFKSNAFSHVENALELLATIFTFMRLFSKVQKIALCFLFFEKVNPSF